MIKIARIAVTLGLFSPGAQSLRGRVSGNDNDLRNDRPCFFPIAGHPSEPVDVAAEPWRDRPRWKRPNLPILLSKWCWPVSTSDCLL